MLLFTAATSQELSAALRDFGPLPDCPQGVPVGHAVAGRDAHLLVSGVGLVNAAWSLGRAVSLPDLSGVINIGVAGSFDPVMLPLRQAVLVRREIWPEYGLWTPKGADARGLGFAQHSNVDTDGGAVWDRIDLDVNEAALAMGLHLDDQWPQAASLSVSSVTTTSERAAMLRRTYAADLENMEGFALAYGCLCAGLPFLELRCVSNKVGSRRNEDWDICGALAALGHTVAQLTG